MPDTPDITEAAPVLSTGRLAYYNQRLRNRVFAEVLRAIDNEIAAGRITRANIARRLGKNPSQVSRWLSGPGNWTLDTVSDLLTAIESELDTRVVFYRDRSRPNYQHPMASTRDRDSVQILEWSLVHPPVDSDSDVQSFGNKAARIGAQ